MKELYFRFVAVAAIIMAGCNFVANADTWDGSSSTAWYDNGSNPYTISSAADLAGLAQLVNNGNTFEGLTINLAADLDLNGNNGNNGLNWTMIGDNSAHGSIFNRTNARFQGTFDGQGHTISNVYVQNEEAAGLFGWIGNNGMVKNLNIENSKFDGRDAGLGSLFTTDYAGAVCAHNYGTISNCVVRNVDPEVSTGDYAGSICGANYGTIDGCLASNNNVINSQGNPVGVPFASINQGSVTGCYYQVNINEECPDGGKIACDTTCSDMRILNEDVIVDIVDGVAVTRKVDVIFVKDGATISLDILTRGYKHTDFTDAGYFVKVTDATGGAYTSEVTAENDILPGENGYHHRLTHITFTVDGEQTTNSTATLSYVIDQSLPTSVENTIAKAQRIFAAGGKAIVEGARGEKILIVDMAGRTVYNNTAQNARMEIALKKGIYIVNGVKVIVR